MYNLKVNNMYELNSALQTVLYNCQMSNDNPFLVNERKEWLEDSKGTIPLNIYVYRPYYVIAWHYWLLPENNLIKGEGAIFDQNYEITRRYLLKQEILDSQYPTMIIPDVYKCSVMLGRLNKDCQECTTDSTSSNTVLSSILGFN